MCPFFATIHPDLVWVGDVGAAVTGVSHAISIPVQLVPVLDTLTVIQKVLQACLQNDTPAGVLLADCYCPVRYNRMV